MFVTNDVEDKEHLVSIISWIYPLSLEANVLKGDGVLREGGVG